MSLDKLLLRSYSELSELSLSTWQTIAEQLLQSLQEALQVSLNPLEVQLPCFEEAQPGFHQPFRSSQLAGTLGIQLEGFIGGSIEPYRTQFVACVFVFVQGHRITSSGGDYFDFELRQTEVGPRWHQLGWLIDGNGEWESITCLGELVGD